MSPQNLSALPGQIGRSFSAGWFLLSCLLYVVLVLLRAWRFKLVTGKSFSYVEMLAISCVHSLWNTLLPMKSGEASYVILVRRLGNVPLGAGVAQLGLIRLVDAFLMLLFSGAGLLFCTGLGAEAMWALCGGLAALALALASLLLHPRWWTGWLRRLPAGRLSAWLAVRAEEFDVSLENISPLLLMRILLLSLPLMFVFYCCAFVTFNMSGLSLNYPQTVAAIGFLIPLSLLPVQGIAGLGTYESALVGGLVFVGSGAEQAVTAAVALHLVDYVQVFSLGLLAQLWLYRRNSGRLKGRGE